MQYIEESIVASCDGRLREGLEKAKEASSKERGLMRLQEQAGLSDSHNLDLTFAVSITHQLLRVISYKYNVLY